jgi:hypothetical protein
LGSKTPEFILRVGHLASFVGRNCEESAETPGDIGRDSLTEIGLPEQFILQDAEDTRN